MEVTLTLFPIKVSTGEKAKQTAVRNGCQPERTGRWAVRQTPLWVCFWLGAQEPWCFHTGLVGAND